MGISARDGMRVGCMNKFFRFCVLLTVLITGCGFGYFYYEKQLKAGKHTITSKLMEGKYLVRVTQPNYFDSGNKKVLFHLKSTIRVGNNVIGALTPDSVQHEQDIEDNIFSKWITVQNNNEEVITELEIIPAKNSGDVEYKFIIEQPKP
jgi:hypothetical protein